MSRVLYFAYGSNLDPKQMVCRCPSARAAFPAQLQDHRLDFTHFSARWSGGSADVVRQSGESVWGIVYELDPADLQRLDRFEGGYRRVFLPVRDAQERTRRVISYEVPLKRSFRPTSPYIQKMLVWGQHWGLPEAYLDRLRRTPVSD